jgi:hypothetical protein
MIDTSATDETPIKHEPKPWQCSIPCLIRVASVALLIFMGIPCALAQAPAPPAFAVHTIDGVLPPTPIEKLGADWSIELGGKPTRTLAVTDWMALRRAGASLPPYPIKNSVVLTTGDRIPLEPGAPLRLDEERLVLRPRQGQELGVPLAYLSYVCLQGPDGVDDPELWLARLDKAARARDAIYLKGGDRIEGTLALPARGPFYTMKLGERSVDTPLEQIAILTMNTEAQARPKPKKTFAHLVTADGARLHFSALRLNSDRQLLTGKTLFGADLDVPLEQVAALTLRHGPAVYLSDVTPKSYRHTPFLGVKWPLARDAAVTGRQLGVGDDYFDKGLGMHSSSVATFALDGAYNQFEALVGLDESADKPGQAKISVAVDGKIVFGPRELSGRQRSVPIWLDVRKAQELALVVDFGNFGDVSGRVNWADARLVRAR